MSFEQSNPTNDLVTIVNNAMENEVPTTLNEMLQNKNLLTCYKCKETFSIREGDPDDQHTLDSNNILLGIILDQRTPSSICLKCLSRRMLDVITEQFTKNSKDYEGLFFNYHQKFKV